jgi:hypothetical protein
MHEALECIRKLSEVGATLTDATNFHRKHHRPGHGKRTFAQVAVELLRLKRKTIVAGACLSANTRPTDEAELVEVKKRQEAVECLAEKYHLPWCTIKKTLTMPVGKLQRSIGAGGRSSYAGHREISLLFYGRPAFSSHVSAIRAWPAAEGCTPSGAQNSAGACVAA